jgi:hypothetical protein
LPQSSSSCFLARSSLSRSHSITLVAKWADIVAVEASGNADFCTLENIALLPTETSPQMMTL